MRLVVTADLHFNHARSRPLAEELIAQINATGGDVLLVVGDTAAGDGPALEQALGMFRFRGPKLFVAGNHELWTHRQSSITLFEDELPRRMREIGWHWLEDNPFEFENVAIVGSVGWYDYSFAVPELQIPDRFYEAKVSPGVAERMGAFKHLMLGDESEASKDIIARWNDGKFVKLGRTDRAFAGERILSMDAQLGRLSHKKSVVAAVHHVPFAQLLPPRRGMQWDFARAYLGSLAMGQMLLRHENIGHVLCGHSHWPVESQIGGMRAINIGSGYRSKLFRQIEL